MLTKLNSFSIIGINALNVEVQVDVSKGLPQTLIVGLADSVVKESKERIKVAIKNSGFKYPLGRITVNLYPADTKKEGTQLDLPIALGILASSNQLNPNLLKDFVFLGELALDGSLKKTKGILISALEAKAKGFKNLIIPKENLNEAAFLEDLNVWGAESLNQVIFILQNLELFPPFKKSAKELLGVNSNSLYDFSEVKGQFQAKRAIEVAVAGFHNILMIGPPGSGKSMLAKRIPTIMPKMELEEVLETSKIYSALGLLPADKPLITQRPFRNPHHTASEVALIGGGNPPTPGEISLAHNGVLFLDELPEFHRDVLESLRQPLEDGFVNISRAKSFFRFPAKVMLVAAMNPCPCGYYTHPKRTCRCSSSKITKYLSKISGPLLDRIDIHIQIPPVELKDLDTNLPQEDSETIRKRVERVRKIQKERFESENIFFNSQMSPKHIKKFCIMQEEAKELLKKAMNELKLSLRAYEKILKLARTIADFEEKRLIEPHHIAEAIQYRVLDREFFR